MKLALILLWFTLAISLASALTLGYLLGPFGTNDARKIFFQVPAITTGGKGVLVPFTLTLMAGTGKIFVNINSDTYSTDTDQSLQIAKFAAEKYLGKSLSNFDIEIDAASSTSSQISGMSATTLFSSVIVANYLGVSIPSDVEVSATINSNGTLGSVGGIDEKILAAINDGKKYFVVSSNQQISNLSILQKNIEIVREKDSSQAINFILFSSNKINQN